MPEPYRIAPDPVAESLIPAPFALPARALARSPWVAPLIHRGLGLATFGTTYHAALRTRAIDDAVREAVLAGIAQIVVLGAGLDSRALRMPELRGARVFEVDHPSSQRYKIERLTRSEAPVPEREKSGEVRRVPIDFEKHRLSDLLPAAGFQVDGQSFWIWEGVTVYLTLEAIESTLRDIASLSSPGSLLAVTYTPPIAGRMGRLLPALRGAFRVLGEPIRTLLQPGEMAGLLDGAGFSLRADDAAPDWVERYWPFELRERVRVVERLAIAERCSHP